ncbi:MAG: hypothetical protein F6K17_11150 [Okeania sp. SIO3C4]|nr:hypothetical protein [Okeania sp. SIO3B3]NER03140.1 hypothetical protein [Okeania sp. SIO3C4]
MVFIRKAEGRRQRAEGRRERMLKVRASYLRVREQDAIVLPNKNNYNAAP